MTDTHRFSVSVAAAVIDEAGRALAIQRNDNLHWEPPGGVLEPGETLHQGLVREVLEETGLHVEPRVLTGVYQNVPRDIVALVYRCHPVSGELRTSDESRRVAWLSTDDVQRLMTEAYAVRVLDALEQTEGAASRCHDGVNLIQ